MRPSFKLLSNELKVQNSRDTIKIVSLVVSVFFAWAAFAPLDEIVRGSGRVVPKMKNQVVQNLEGGIVKDIFVVEGDSIEAGEVLVKMDATQFESAYKELQEQQLALLLKISRLRAEEVLETDFIIGDELKEKAPQYAESEQSLFEARRGEHLSTLSDLATSLQLKQSEVDILQPMVVQQAVPEIDLIRAKQEIVEIQTRLTAVKGEFETRRSQELSDVIVELRQVEEKILSRLDQLRRTDVTSPVNGIVNKVLATTIGGVVRPGDPLVEILPLDEVLRVEGRISPRDIGFVFLGMPATVKLTAFDFSVYGTLKGRVVHVGADTVIDESDRDPAPYYEVFIEIDNTRLNGPEGSVEIRPGMQADIELESGQKTVLEYLLKPLFKTTEALTER